MGVPPSAPRRRPRPGSPERPVNARMYRGTWLILSIPLLLAAFSVARPTALPAAFPPAFDASSAQTLATELAAFNPERFPDTQGAAASAAWFRKQLAPYNVTVRAQPFHAEVPGYGRVEMQNLVATVRGRSDRRIVVLAHRDALPAGPGANDNASGTAALIVLARSFSTAPSSEDQRQGSAHTLVFVSTDGGALGGAGATHYAESETGEVDAVINLDAIAGPGAARLQLAGDRPRSPSWTLVRTASARLLDQTGAVPDTPSAFRQLIDLAFPLSLYEQAPFVGRGVPAVTITTDPDHPRAPELDGPPANEQERERRERRLAQVGGAAQTLIGSVDQGLEVSRGGSPYLYFGSRVVRGWAVQLVLVAALLPFLAAAVDLFARCRRRRIPLAPAVRSYRSRLTFWLFVGAIFALLAKFGAWPHGDAFPISPYTDAAHAWPFGAIAVLLAAALVGWFVARDRLIPRRAVSIEEQLAGHTAALLVLGLIALLVVAVNPFALVFVLPSLHAWLWLPQVRARPIWTRAAVLAAGFAGPALLLWSLGTRLGLGLDAPAYLVELVAVGYVPLPLVVLFLAWLGVSGQLAALAAGRYAPYPEAAERPPRGPVREVIRRLLFAIERRRASRPARQALEG
jgi:peptidase M28-like protein